jgi:hypothetical protein
MAMNSWPSIWGRLASRLMASITSGIAEFERELAWDRQARLSRFRSRLVLSAVLS